MQEQKVRSLHRDEFAVGLEEGVEAGETQALLPGRYVHLGKNSHVVERTAQQAVQRASRLLDGAGLTVATAFFAEGREPTPNERHVLNLLSWRSREAQQQREEIAVLREYLEVLPRGFQHPDPSTVHGGP